jgi:hypothetical protein
MIEDRLFEIIDPVLRSAGSLAERGEEFRTPPLEILRYYLRPVRLSWLPFLGRASSVVAVVRQPVDVGFRPEDYRRFLTRLAMAVNGRFPPWSWTWTWTWPSSWRSLGLGLWLWPWSRSRRRGPTGGGLVIGLTVVVLTPEPIGPEDDATLGQLLGSLPARRTRTRAVPLGLIRLNLGQEAVAFALASGPAGLFTEPEALADALSLHFRRFVPMIDT